MLVEIAGWLLISCVWFGIVVFLSVIKIANTYPVGISRPKWLFILIAILAGPIGILLIVLDIIVFTFSKRPPKEVINDKDSYRGFSRRV